MVERFNLIKKYIIGNVKACIFEVESGTKKKYICALIDEGNMEIWGRGETAYEALLDARERWNNSFGGFNPFKYALQYFP